eukprot:g13988.t1
MARLSFGLYEYDEFVSDGLGQGFEGIGMANGDFYKYLILWIAFLLLSTIIVNILIAVISDGYEIHKDKQRLRTNSGETFIMYTIRRLVYILFFQFFPCFKKCQPLWVKKLRFTSSKHAKTLLYCCDATISDGEVFDKKLQVTVLRRIIGKANGIRSGCGVFRKSDVLNSNDIITHESTYEVFSRIYSKKTLELVINTIFSTELEKEMGIMVKSFKLKDVYQKMWDLYKHTDEIRKEKEECKVEGNHVRKVVKPMEARLKRKIAEVQTETMKMREKMENMEKKMDLILKNFLESQK